jgi:hypothetical protein
VLPTAYYVRGINTEKRACSQASTSVSWRKYGREGQENVPTSRALPWLPAIRPSPPVQRPARFPWHEPHPIPEQSRSDIPRVADRRLPVRWGATFAPGSSGLYEHYSTVTSACQYVHPDGSSTVVRHASRRASASPTVSIPRSVFGSRASRDPSVVRHTGETDQQCRMRPWPAARLAALGDSVRRDRACR